jgi:hypothetical protein
MCDRAPPPVGRRSRRDLCQPIACLRSLVRCEGGDRVRHGQLEAFAVGSGIEHHTHFVANASSIDANSSRRIVDSTYSSLFV